MSNVQGEAELTKGDFLELLTGAFVDPGRVGRWIAARGLDRRAVLVVVLSLVVTGLAIALVAPLQLDEQMTQLARNPRIPEAQRDEALDRFATLAAHPAFRVGIAFAGTFSVAMGSLLVVVIGWALDGWTRGGVGFQRMFAIFAWVSPVALAARLLARSALSLAKGSIHVSTGLGVVLAERSLFDPLRSVLDVADLFGLWATWIAAAMYAAAAGTDRRRGLLVCGLAYLLIAGIGCALRIVGGAMS